MQAALLFASGAPLEIADDLEVVGPGPGQVVVGVSHCGICHSDVTVVESGGVGLLPMVLGHEAAGLVEEVGAGVTSVRPGDHVVLSVIDACGRCYYCLHGQPTMCASGGQLMSGVLPDGTVPFRRAGQPVYRGLGVGGFAQRVLTSEGGVVRIDPDIPLELAAVIGCAIQTGVGAALNAAGVEPGATVLVTGLGGVGLSVLQGARVAGAARIIVSDPLEERRERASRLGATDVLDPARDDVVQAVRELTGGVGVDYAFDAAGRSQLLEAGLLATRNGGTVVSVGVPAMSETLNVSPAMLFCLTEKRLIGSLYGSGHPARDIPRLVEMWQRGQIDIETMVTTRRPLAEVNEGMDDIRSGRGVRTVLTLRAAS